MRIATLKISANGTTVYVEVVICVYELKFSTNQTATQIIAAAMACKDTEFQNTEYTKFMKYKNLNSVNMSRDGDDGWQV